MPLPTPRTVGGDERRREFGLPLGPPGSDTLSGDAAGMIPAVGSPENISRFDIGGGEPMLPQIPNLSRVDLAGREAPVRDQGRFKRNRTLAALGLLSAGLAGSGSIAQAGASLARGAAANELAANEEFGAAMTGFEEFQAEGQQFNLEQAEREQLLGFEQEQDVFDTALGQRGSERIQALIQNRQESQARLEQDLKENDPLNRERLRSEQALQVQRRASARKSDRGPSGGAVAKVPRSNVTGRTARPTRAVERDISGARIDLETANESLENNLDLTKEAEMTRRVRQAQLKVQQLQEELGESRTIFSEGERRRITPTETQSFLDEATNAERQRQGGRPTSTAQQGLGAPPPPSAFAGQRDVGAVIDRVDAEATEAQVEIREVLSEMLETGNAQSILQFADEALRLGAITEQERDLLVEEFPQSLGQQ